MAAWGRYAGDDLDILAALHSLYRKARELNPARWSGSTRNWSPVGAATLNPERDSIIKAHLAGNNIQALILRTKISSRTGIQVHLSVQAQSSSRLFFDRHESISGGQNEE